MAGGCEDLRLVDLDAVHAGGDQADRSAHGGRRAAGDTADVQHSRAAVHAAEYAHPVLAAELDVGPDVLAPVREGVVQRI